MPSLAFMGGADKHNALAGMFGMGAGCFRDYHYSNCALDCIFIGAAILHVCLMIVGGAKQPFETTFRVVCFRPARPIR